METIYNFNKFLYQNDYKLINQNIDYIKEYIGDIKNVLDKSVYGHINAKKQIERISKDYPIDHIFIEPALNMFMMGRTSSHTISTLTKFNGILSWLCYEEFGIKPEYIPAISARKKCGITIKDFNDYQKKDIIEAYNSTITERRV